MTPRKEMQSVGKDIGIQTIRASDYKRLVCCQNTTDGLLGMERERKRVLAPSPPHFSLTSLFLSPLPLPPSPLSFLNAPLSLSLCSLPSPQLIGDKFQRQKLPTDRPKETARPGAADQQNIRASFFMSNWPQRSFGSLFNDPGRESLTMEHSLCWTGKRNFNFRSSFQSSRKQCIWKVKVPLES